MTHDGIGKYLAQVVEKAPGQTDDVVGILKETGTDVVNYLPVAPEAATKWYTEQILEAGVAMVNCMPVFIAREPYWQKRSRTPAARSSGTTSSRRSAPRSRIACSRPCSATAASTSTGRCS